MKLSKLFHGVPPLDWLRFGGAFFSCVHTISPIYSLIETLYMEFSLMDITKWKSVLVPIEVYEQIRTIAKAEGRTISGQLRIMWEVYKETRVKELQSR